MSCCHISVSHWPSCRPRMVVLFLCSMALVFGVLVGGGAMASEVVAASSTAVVGAKSSFRVETEIFEGKEDKPVSQHLLLFDGAVVYDLPITTGTTITVFDPGRQRVLLLHKVQRVRSVISTESLTRSAAQVRAAATRSEAKDKLGLGATVRAAGASGEYVMEFGDTRYEVATQEVSQEAAARQFAEFTIWACRLNIARHLGSPPFARITLAEHLAAQGELPRRVKLDVRVGLRTRSLRSEHLYVGRLSDLDRKKISEVGQMIASFEEVDLSQFPRD